jgi:hypothetical protein
MISNCSINLQGRATNVSATTNEECSRTASGSAYLTFSIPVNLSKQTDEIKKCVWFKVMIFFSKSNMKGATFEDHVDASKQRDIAERFDKLNKKHYIILNNCTFMGGSGMVPNDKAKAIDPNSLNLTVMCDSKNVTIISLEPTADSGGGNSLFNE